MSRLIFGIGLIVVIYLCYLSTSFLFSNYQIFTQIIYVVGLITIFLAVVKVIWLRINSRSQYTLITKAILGGDLATSIQNFLQELPNPTKITTANLVGTIVGRFSRIAILATLITVIPIVLLFIQNSKIQSQNDLIGKQTILLESQNSLIDDQILLEEANRRAGLTTLFSSVLDELSRELDNSPDRRLSPQLTARIKSLSGSLHPYTYIENGKRIKNSPERGQLFSALVSSKINPESLWEILRLTSFEYADLRGFKLQFLDIGGANLTNANLENAMFNYCKFYSVNFTSANLNNTLFQNSSFDFCVFDSTNFSSSTIKVDTFANTSIVDSDVSNSTFENVLFKLSRIYRSDFSKSKFLNLNIERTAILKSRLDQTKGNIEELTNLMTLEDDVLQWRKDTAQNSLFGSIIELVDTQVVDESVDVGYDHLFYKDPPANLHRFIIDWGRDTFQQHLLLLNQSDLFNLKKPAPYYDLYSFGD